MSDSSPAPGRPGFAIPGFRLLRTLGEGGMGCVYLARDEVLGRLVAIKTVSARAARDDAAYARFLREARLMATLEHPHVVQIHALTEVEGGHAIIMQYVGGQSLARHVVAEHQLGVGEALRITRECALALGAAWRHGIVHRDLKPSNILLDEDMRTLVADFGLAYRVAGAGSLGEIETDNFFCTPHYASPEQLQGEAELDVRSDIYSLGLVLYEMLAGERPYRAATPLDVLRRALTEPVPDPREHRGDLPAEMSDLVAWMAAKDPRARPACIDELVRTLDALVPQSQGVLPTFPSTDDWFPGPVGGYERIPPLFVGRERELVHLDTSLAGARTGAGQVVVVRGEAGTGKTALVNAFARHAVAREHDLIALGTACAPAAAEPFSAFREALALLTGDVTARLGDGAFCHLNADRLARSSLIQVRRLLEDYSGLVGTFVHPDTLLHPATSHGAPEDWIRSARSKIESLRLMPAGRLARHDLFEQYCDLVRRASAEAPILFVIDDLQWIDPDSVALLRHLARRLDTMPVLLVLCLRGSEVAIERDGLRHPAASALNEFLGRPEASILDLDASGDLAFVEAILDSERNLLSRRFRKALYERTGGHPLFTLELIKSLKVGSSILRDASGAWVDADVVDWGRLPARVEAAIRERVERLSPTQRRLLTVAAVEGPIFTADIVALIAGVSVQEAVHLLSDELSGRHALVAAQGVRELCARRVLTYRFAHVLFQQYVYEALDDVQRAMLHEEVAHVLSDWFGDSQAEIADELAYHYEAAGAIEQAIDFFALAGAEAWRIAAYARSIEAYERALGLCDRLQPSADLHDRRLRLILGLLVPTMAIRGWTNPRVLELLVQAEALGRTSSDRQARLAVLIASAAILSTATRPRESMERALPAVDLAREFGTPAFLYCALNTLATCQLHLGLCREPRRILEQCVTEFYGRTTDHGADVLGTDSAASAFAWLSTASWVSGDVRAIRDAIARATELAERYDEPHTWTLVRFHETHGWLVLGEFDRALAAIEHGERLARVHELPLMGNLLHHLRGTVLVSLGDAEAGARLILEAETASRDLNAYPGQVYMVRDRAALALLEGRIEAGLALLDEALAFYGPRGENLLISELHRVRGGLLLARNGSGDATEAEACLVRARDIATGQGCGFGAVTAALDLGRRFARCGRTDEAREELRRALDAYPGMKESVVGGEARTLLEQLA